MNERRDIQRYIMELYNKGELRPCIYKELRRDKAYNEDDITEAVSNAFYIPLTQAMDSVRVGSTICLKISRDLLQEEGEEDNAAWAQRTHVSVPTMLMELRSADTRKSYPLNSVLPSVVHHEDTLYWRLVGVLCQVVEVWRSMVEQSSTENDNWRAVIIAHVNATVLNCGKRRSYTASLERIRSRSFVRRMYERHAAVVDDVTEERRGLLVASNFFNVPGQVYSKELGSRGLIEWEVGVRHLSLSTASIAFFWTDGRNADAHGMHRVQSHFVDDRGREWVLRCVWRSAETYLVTGNCVWKCNRGSTFPVAVGENLPMEVIDDWNGLWYVHDADDRAKARRDFLGYIGGQSTAECGHCRLYLIRERRKSGKRCCIEECGAQATYSCSTRYCGSCVCKRHLASAVENDEVLIIRGEQLRLPTERTTEAEGIGEAVDDEAYVGVSCMPWALTTHEDRRIPGHLLLNGVLRCLRRPRNTVELNLRQRRFIESIVARTPAGSVSLELPEAVLFPGIFFKTAEDGGVYGALPMCMWSKAYDVEQLGIAGLREHLLTRLQDGALQTSRNEDYITWAFSTLFNTALSRSDSRLVLSRGYYSLTGGQVSVEEGSVLPFDELDSRRAVKQLAASLAASPNVLKVFLTLTCNLSTHFGIAPVTAALREHMENLTKDESTSVWEGALVDLTLGWERAMRYFIEYLQKSEEHILGEIETVFARWEFQDSSGNLPHLHCLLKLRSEVSVEEIRDRISCATTTAYDLSHGLYLSPGTLERIREAGLAQTWEECCEYLRDYKRTQAHDCKKANSRCIKKRRVVSDEGSTATEWVEECRVPLHLPAREHGFKLIEAPHSNDALKVLERIGLAHRDKPENKPKVCGSLQAGRHTYAADKGESYTCM